MRTSTWLIVMRSADTLLQESDEPSPPFALRRPRAGHDRRSAPAFRVEVDRRKSGRRAGDVAA